MAVAQHLRKVLAIGKRSLMCTLPIAWVRANQLEKGSLLCVEVISDGSLKIVPAGNNQNGTGARNADPPVAASPIVNKETRDD